MLAVFSPEDHCLPEGTQRRTALLRSVYRGAEQPRTARK